jgi:hypothetical protein
VRAVLYHLNLRLILLQQWRMVHALAEGSQRFTIPDHQTANLEHLKQYFDVPLEVGEGEPVAPKALLVLNTDEPWSEVAGLRRTLIYPHGMLDRCREMWPEERPVRFGFAGLEYRQRGGTLDTWQERTFGGAQEAIRLRRDEDLSVVPRPSDVAVVYSRKGRSFPAKMWDESYFRLLADSEFTLCPDGEEVWTYRFFEAMVCGSMPVVESDCGVYQGFRYRFLDDTGADATVAPEDLEHNFALCRERLTLPLEGLDSAVEGYLSL